MSAIPFTNDVSFSGFRHLEIKVEPQYRVAWMHLHPSPRPCFTIELLNEIQSYQRALIQYGGRLPYEGSLIPIDYQVLHSDDPNIFSLGGDLERFLQCAQNGNRDWLLAYAKTCIDVLHPNIVGYNLPMTTISLVRGDALGGGFESALSSHVVIAERHAQMGLPEVLFNLFPGMGAYQLLARRIGPARAERMILSGRMYNAEELYDMGVVDVLAEPGEGENALYSFLRTHKKRSNAQKAIRKVRERVNPVSYEELLEVTDIWVDAVMTLEDKDKRTMARLLRGQDRMLEVGRSSEPGSSSREKTA